MSFFDVVNVYDFGILVAFALFLLIIFYKNRDRIKIEGVMILYRTGLGIEIMDKIGQKYKKTLKVLSYFSIVTGYILMLCILYLVGLILYSYIKFPQITEIISAPPVVPIFPYFTNVFGLESFFPTFYATYFILVVGITMFVHEFAHGIFMRFNKIKIKSTGLAFLLLLIPGAFVEQDDKSMNSKSKFAQMSVLSAGVFANTIAALISFMLLILFFSNFFVASGAIFNTYPMAVINGSEIDLIGGWEVSGMDNRGILDLIEEYEIKDEQIGEFNLTKVTYQNVEFLVPIENLKNSLENGGGVQIFYDSPSINAGFPKLEFFQSAAITEINGMKINDYESLTSEMENYSPGDKANMKIKFSGEIKEFDLTLGTNPFDNESPFIGISYYQTKNPLLNFYKDEQTLYEPKDGRNSYILIHDFLWWLALINILVALFNMLPVGILDGGRFFYLTVLKITKSEKVAKKSFKVFTWLILFSFVLLILRWLFLRF